VVGDVIGKYHPHGDTAVYDAMVRLAQEFAVRYPLVDGQGNFGNIDGDNPAAMRYTEARLTAVASALLEGLDQDTVDFRATYDGEEEEPVVLPARFPNLLANGSSGIAVGMATNVPPHNVGELCDALVHLLKRPNATMETLVEKIPGPDFPTGGILVEGHDSIVESYRTGRGSFRLRARWEIETLPRGQYQIIVTEIPYQVPKARVIEKIAGLMEARKLVLLGDVLDESAETVRIVFEPKSRTVEPETLMESLFRQTDLEVRISLNLNVLDGHGVPRVMNLREALQAFLDHRHEVLVRRSNHRLQTIAKRLEVLGGYLVVFLNLDRVIRIVREEDDPKQALIKRFKITDAQAEAILNMRLRALRKLEEIAIIGERDALEAEKSGLEALLADDSLRRDVLIDELKDIRANFGEKTELGLRRTEIGAPPSAIDVPAAAMIEREPITVLCSEKGWIRAVKGHGNGTETKYKEGDRERFVITAETTDKLVVFATNGRFYTLGCDKLPRGRGFGEPLRLMIDLGNDQDIIAVFVHQEGRRLLVVASDGRGFVVGENDVIAQKRQGKQVLNLGAGAEAAVCAVIDGDTVAVIGDNRKLLLFPLDDMPVMTRGRGVILQRYRDGGLADAKTFNRADGLTWRSGERTRTHGALDDWLGTRGQSGRPPPTGFPRSNRFS
ncbi:MAG: DNA topoisomerase IV subunit A, partial [Alphaproteobacteria bacterium]